MKNFLITLFIIPIKLYRLLISPLFPPRCIYHPSCSNYTIDAIKLHGPIKGIVFGTLRILRCSPLFKGGVDVVTESSTLKEQFIKYKEFIRKVKR